MHAFIPGPHTPSPIPILVFGCSKGGTGKSTITCHQAVAALHCGRNPVIFDCDLAQQSAKGWSRLRREDPPIVKAVAPAALGRALAWALSAGHDEVYVDLPGRDGSDLAPILTTASIVICPAQMTTFDLLGAKPMLQSLRDLNLHHFVLLNRVHRATATRVGQFKTAFANLATVLNPVLTDRLIFGDCIAQGRTAFEYAGGAARSAAEEQWNVHRELRRRLREITHG